MEKKRLSYEPPQARDLSAFGVSGQGPLGFCEFGGYPYVCAVGNTADMYCDIGAEFGQTSPCLAGPLPATSDCVTGSNPTTP
jgi:hypothetical protein